MSDQQPASRAKQPPDPKTLEYIKTTWKEFIIPGESLETAEDLDRLQARVSAMLRAGSAHLEKRLTELAGAVKNLMVHHERLLKASEQLETANKGLATFANVVARSLTFPS